MYNSGQCSQIPIHDLTNNRHSQERKKIEKKNLKKNKQQIVDGHIMLNVVLELLDLREGG